VQSGTDPWCGLIIPDSIHPIYDLDPLHRPASDAENATDEPDADADCSSDQ
jgi:hypothetical protein